LVQFIINFLAEQGLLKPAPPLRKKRVKKTLYTITLGGDPEFELVDSLGKVKNASVADEFNENTPYGVVGIDGSGYQIELRPNPGDPDEVVTNIHKLLEKFNSLHSGIFSLAPSSELYPCGGHIHIGVTPLPNEDYYTTLTTVLDDFIGRPTSKLNGRAREDGNELGYGKIGDWRRQNYGMEYRTPPNAIWKNPELARIVLKLTYNLAVILANNLGLEYSTPIDKIQLVSIGGLTELETSIYLAECQKLAPSKKECLLAAWDVKPVTPKPRIRICYHDYWCGEVKRIINKLFATVEVSKSINLEFYGLRLSLGNVFTFDLPRKEKVPSTRRGGDSWFGFSYKFRKGETSLREIENAVMTVSKIILDQQPKEIK
jgi:hypothetical protein